MYDLLVSHSIIMVVSLSNIVEYYENLTRASHSNTGTGALKDPAFQKLWQRVESYRKKLIDCGLTDKFVKDAMKKKNRDKTLQIRISENLVPLVRCVRV